MAYAAPVVVEWSPIDLENSWRRKLFAAWVKVLAFLRFWSATWRLPHVFRFKLASNLRLPIFVNNLSDLSMPFKTCIFHKKKCVFLFIFCPALLPLLRNGFVVSFGFLNLPVFLLQNWVRIIREHLSLFKQFKCFFALVLKPWKCTFSIFCWHWFAGRY